MNKIKVKDAFDLVNGYPFKSSKYVDEGIRIIRIANVQDGYIADNYPCFYPNAQINSFENQILKENDLLMSLTGNVGRVGILPIDLLPAALNQRVLCLRPYNVDDNKYFYYYFRSKHFSELARINSNGIAQLNMSTEWLKNHDIPFYDKVKRKEIVDNLNFINNVLMELNNQVKLYDELVKSRFNEMFGDAIINDKNWKLEYLSELGTLERGKSKHRPRNDSRLLNGPYPLIQTGDIINSKLYIDNYKSTYSEFGLAQSKLWPIETLCITIAANIANTSILKFEACFPDSIVGFTANKRANVVFVKYLFNSFQKILEEQAPAAAQKNINLKILNNIAVICPPIELQNKFSDFVKLIDKSKLEVQHQIELTQELLDKKMNEYFGECDS